jgi:hypothetical protein
MNFACCDEVSRCFSAIYDYIAPQRVKACPVLWPGFLFGRHAPFEFQVLSVIRKSGSRFSGEIVLQPLPDPEEEL